MVGRSHNKNGEVSIQEKENSPKILSLFEKWQNNNMKQICPMVKEWKVQELITLFNKKDRSILREISHIRFPQLKTVFLEKSEIESVEGFHRVKVPTLQEIFLKNNKICSLREFRKMRPFQELYLLSIILNSRIVKADSLNRMHSKYKMKSFQKIILGLLSSEVLEHMKIKIVDE